MAKQNKSVKEAVKLEGSLTKETRILEPRFDEGKRTVRPWAFVKTLLLDEAKGLFFGYGLVREEEKKATYAAVVTDKETPDHIVIRLGSLAKPEHHEVFHCKSCEREVRVAPLASTVEKRVKALAKDPTKTPRKMTRCPSCFDEQAKAEAQNAVAL